MEKIKAESEKVYFRVLFFRFLIECFFEIFMAAFLNSYALRAGTVGDWINSLLTVTALFVCFNLPLTVFVLYTEHQKRLEADQVIFWRKYGVFFEGVDTKKYGAILVCSVFFMRRISFVLIAGLM